MEEVFVHVGKVVLPGLLSVPGNAKQLILCPHVSGSQPQIAKVFKDAGLATLVLDLLTEEEKEIDLVTRHLRFDVFLLADRIVEAIEWAQEKGMRIGILGSSTVAAAAVVAAADLGEKVGAVVSMDGRLNLVPPQLNASNVLIAKTPEEAAKLFLTHPA